VTTPHSLRLAPAPAEVGREHADRATYKAWVDEHCSSYAVRWARLDDYDRFVDRWSSLQDWFDAPLRKRLLDKENCLRGGHPHGGASVIMPYLTYLSLVHGVGLDYPVLLARTFTSPFKHQARYGGLGVDADLFDRHVAGWPSSATPLREPSWSGPSGGCCCTAATRTSPRSAWTTWTSCAQQSTRSPPGCA